MFGNGRSANGFPRHEVSGCGGCGRAAKRRWLRCSCAPSLRPPFGVSSAWALGLAQAVADGARFPPLILVTTGLEGVNDTFVVPEGHARLTAFMLRPDALPPELDVLVGASPKMPDWGLY
jgi:hypothetical protein